MGKETFRYFRFVAKIIGLVFALAGVSIFIIEFLPTYTGRGIAFGIFIFGGILWAFDTFGDAITGIRGMWDSRQNQ
jgi:hypothetical protein